MFFDHYYRTETGECVDKETFADSIFPVTTIEAAIALEKYISVEIFGIDGTFSNGKSGLTYEEIYENLPEAWKKLTKDSNGNVIENPQGIPEWMYPKMFQCTWFAVCMSNMYLQEQGSSWYDHWHWDYVDKNNTGTKIPNGGDFYWYNENYNEVPFESSKNTPQPFSLGCIKNYGGHTTHIFFVTGVTYDAYGNVEGIYAAECGNGLHWMGVNYYDKEFIDKCNGFLYLPDAAEGNASQEEMP